MEFEFKGKKENRIVAWFKKLSKKKKAALIAAAILLVVILIVAGYVWSKFSKIDKEDFDEGEIIINEDLAEDLGEGYTNFVLFGADSRTNDVTSDLNTDSIIIASLNNETKEVKLISVYRDTLLDMTTGSIQKCNSAYRRGGAKQAINMLNMNFDLNIQKYVTVSWGVVSDVVDMLGGIEVEVSEAEMNAMNKYIPSTAKVAGKKAVLISEAGLQTLDGVQAATYARIRKGVGDDYARTGRQRELVELLLKKAMQADLVTINNIIDAVLPSISTNFTMTEIVKYVSNIANYKIVDNSGFPFDNDTGNLGARGSCLWPVSLTSNVSELHEYLFGTIDYEPSSKVQSISDEIAYVVNTSKSSSNSNDDEDWEEKTTAKDVNSEETTTTKEVTTTEQEKPTEGTTATEQVTTTEEQTSTEPSTEHQSTTATQPSTTESPSDQTLDKSASDNPA